MGEKQLATEPHRKRRTNADSKAFLPTENAEKADGNPIKRVFMDFDFIRIFRLFRVLKKVFRF